MNLESVVHPEDRIERQLEQKRASFVADYRLQGKPVIIWQFQPQMPCAVDLEQAELINALSEGARDTREDNWWCAFEGAGRPKLVFDGIASRSPIDDSGYGTELHQDGHLLAAVWTFPDVDGKPAASWFHDFAFRDAFMVAKAVMQSIGAEVPIAATCTLLNAESLPFTDRGHSVNVPASRRHVLRWPIQCLTIEELTEAWKRQSSQFFRIYDKRRPQQ